MCNILWTYFVSWNLEFRLTFNILHLYDYCLLQNTYRYQHAGLSNCFPDIICSYYHSIFSKFGLIIPLRELKNSNDFIAYRVSRIFVLHIIVIDQGSVGWMVKVSVTEKWIFSLVPIITFKFLYKLAQIMPLS